MTDEEDSPAKSIVVSVKQIIVALTIAVITAGFTFAFTEGRAMARLQVQVTQHDKEIRETRQIVLESSKLINKNAVAIAGIVGEHNRSTGHIN